MPWGRGACMSCGHFGRRPESPRWTSKRRCRRGCGWGGPGQPGADTAQGRPLWPRGPRWRGGVGPSPSPRERAGEQRWSVQPRPGPGGTEAASPVPPWGPHRWGPSTREGVAAAAADATLRAQPARPPAWTWGRQRPRHQTRTPEGTGSWRAPDARRAGTTRPEEGPFPASLGATLPPKAPDRVPHTFRRVPRASSPPRNPVGGS